MRASDKQLQRLRESRGEAAFRDVKAVCDRYFGMPRVHGSHYIYRTPWKGDPRVNIQNRNGRVAAYQVRQVLFAVMRLEEGHGEV